MRRRSGTDERRRRAPQEATTPPRLKAFSCCFRYCLEEEDAGDYVLCDVIGRTGADNQWKRECFRVVGDHEKPLMLQSLWKPKEGFSRRFEIQLRVSVEAQSLKDRDTVTAGTGLPPRRPSPRVEPLPPQPSLSILSAGGSSGNKSCREGQRRSAPPLPALIFVLLRLLCCSSHQSPLPAAGRLWQPFCCGSLCAALIHTCTDTDAPICLLRSNCPFRRFSRTLVLAVPWCVMRGGVWAQSVTLVPNHVSTADKSGSAAAPVDIPRRLTAPNELNGVCVASAPITRSPLISSLSSG